MKNRISEKVTGILYQAQRALPGVQANLAALGYSAAQGTAFNTKITDAVAARDTHAAALVTLSTSRAAYKKSVLTARTATMTARDTLKPHLGREHSATWAEAGFPTNLAVAQDVPGLLRHVQGLKTYFTAHLDHEVAALDITGARFTALATDLIDRTAALDTAQASIITLAKDRDAKAKLVREELRLLLGKLRVSFDPFAAMWETVGFNRPGFRSVPAVPLNFLAVLVTATSAALNWERAERYRVWKKVIGADEEFVLIATREELDFVADGLPTGKTIEFAVSAVNSGGESARSKVAVITT